MTKNSKILVCDDLETLSYLLKEQLLEEGFTVDTVYDGKYAIEALKRKNYDLLLLDLNMQEVSGEEVLKFISDYNPSLIVVILTAQNEIRKAIDCIKMGAYDYITKPYEFDELLVTINNAAEHKSLLNKNTALIDRVNKKLPHNIVGDSPQLQKIINLASKAALSDSNILIEGETGTGKELFAEYIHKHSTRADKPFVVINCASLPDQLIESELFGHERGAFTDAKSSKQGLVEIANGGTLFLDEIGDVTNLNSNVRVIGATNRNLLEEADNKNFRRDLLFRLNVITLTIPPLRDRRDDIPVLANFFLEAKSPIRSPKKLSPKSELALLNYNFPGNVRELEHTIERAIIFSEGEFIDTDDLNLPVSSTAKSTQALMDEEDIRITEILSMDEMEKYHIAKVLKLNRWDRTQTANQLGISPKTLYTKIKKYEIRQD